MEEGSRYREDLPAAGFLGGQGEGGRLEVDRFPLERGHVAEPLAGVEAGEDEAAPFALGVSQKLPELLHGEGAPFALAVRLAQGFDLGGRVLLDQAVPPRLLKRDPDDFELFVDRAGPNPGAYFVPEMGDVGGCAECEILVRPVTQGGDELGRGRLVFLQRGGRHRPLPETRPAGQVVLGRVRFKPPPRLGLVDVGDHPSRLGLGEVCFGGLLVLDGQFDRDPAVGRFGRTLGASPVRQGEAREPEWAVGFSSQGSHFQQTQFA